MHKPRIFISSTFYDLKYIRNRKSIFLENLGYQPIRNEEGDIPYGKDDGLKNIVTRKYRYFNFTIGGIGTESKNKDLSISNLEI
jgi:hypothetical protein